MLKKIIYFLVFTGLLSACSNDETKEVDPVEQAAADKKSISAYAAENGLNGQFTDSGLYYVVEEEGSGDNPRSTATVTVHYKGYLLDETEFDSSYQRDEPASFGLSNVILGWQEGIPLFKKGGKGKLLIPSALGYGNQRVGSIPPNSVLVFDIELLDF